MQSRTQRSHAKITTNRYLCQWSARMRTTRPSAQSPVTLAHVLVLRSPWTLIAAAHLQRHTVQTDTQRYTASGSSANVGQVLTGTSVYLRARPRRTLRQRAHCQRRLLPRRPQQTGRAGFAWSVMPSARRSAQKRARLGGLARAKLFPGVCQQRIARQPAQTR